MPDYSQGKIYIIHNTENELKYVGSTTQSLSKRMAKHRMRYIHENLIESKIYKAFNDIGIEKFYIELHHYYSCSSKAELEAEEGKIIRELGTYTNGLNSIINGRTLKEYCITHVNEIKENKKKYYKENIEHIKERKKKFYEEHKKEILEGRKDYIKEYSCKKVVCPTCNLEMNKSSLKRHVTNMHK